MGVKDLWSVLAPISQKSSLYDLQDQVIAIDLSCWVCEGQCIGEKVATQPRMYLRNLFFRTQTLLMMNVTPIFILEGQAPAMKHDTMKQRSDARFKKYRIVDQNPDELQPKERKPNRSRFNGILKTCQQMLQHMGVMCLQSDGEAEALCGQLSREKLVDGVISQDSDVFLYGASTVYRNLTIKGGGGTVDVYRMSDIETKLNLTRQKLVAMSLLCGCDYDQTGVQGVGKEIAFKYLSADHRDILNRLRSLRNDQRIHRLEEEKNGCSKCCHSGKLSQHKKDGCPKCEMSKGCEENTSPSAYKNLNDEDRKIATIEIILRKKAVEDATFPNEQTIKEFLNTNQTLTSFKPNWLKPNICKFAHFCTNMLEWEIEYCFEKILPLFTRWLLLNGKCLDNDELLPNSIVKKRIVKGVPSFDLAWEIIDENLASYLTLLPDDSKLLSDGMFVSIEPQILISQSLNDIYSNFIEKTTKKKKSSRKIIDVPDGQLLVKPKKAGGKKKLLEKVPKCSSPLVENNLNVSFGLLNISGVETGRNFKVSEKLLLGNTEPEPNDNLDVTFGLIDISGVEEGRSINLRSFNVSEKFSESLVVEDKNPELNESILSNSKEKLNFTFGAYDYPAIGEISKSLDEFPKYTSEVSQETISQNTIDIGSYTNELPHSSYKVDANLMPSENTSKILQDSENATSLSFLKEVNFSDTFNYCPDSEVADESGENFVSSEISMNLNPIEIDANFNISFDCFNSLNDFSISIPADNVHSPALEPKLKNYVTNASVNGAMESLTGYNDVTVNPSEIVITKPYETSDVIKTINKRHQKHFVCCSEPFNGFNDVTIDPRERVFAEISGPLRKLANFDQSHLGRTAANTVEPKISNDVTITDKQPTFHSARESFNCFNDVTVIPSENVLTKPNETSDVKKATDRQYFGFTSESFNGFNDVTIQPLEKVIGDVTKTFLNPLEPSSEFSNVHKNSCAITKVQSTFEETLESLTDSLQEKLGKSTLSERQEWVDVSNEKSDDINACDSSVEYVSNININKTIDLEEDDDATVEYDLSAIVDDIVSRSHFY